MDVICPNCGEPWSVDHLRHGAPYEWTANAQDAKVIGRQSAFASTDDPALRVAQVHGWQFANLSLTSFVRCSACPKDDGSQPGLSFALRLAQNRDLGDS